MKLIHSLEKRMEVEKNQIALHFNVLLGNIVDLFSIWYTSG